MRVYDAQTKGTTCAQVCAHVCAERECEEFGRHPWKVAMGVRVHTDGSMSTMSTMSTMCVLPNGSPLQYIYFIFHAVHRRVN